MAEYSEDYLAGWYAARKFYQHQNSVPPHPPGHETQSEPEAAAAATEVTEGEDDG